MKLSSLSLWGSNMAERLDCSNLQSMQSPPANGPAYLIVSAWARGCQSLCISVQSVCTFVLCLRMRICWVSSFVNSSIWEVKTHIIWDLKTACGSCGVMGTVSWILFTSDGNVYGVSRSESITNSWHAIFNLEMSLSSSHRYHLIIKTLENTGWQCKGVWGAIWHFIQVWVHYYVSSFDIIVRKGHMQ